MSSAPARRRAPGRHRKPGRHRAPQQYGAVAELTSILLRRPGACAAKSVSIIGSTSLAVALALPAAQAAGGAEAPTQDPTVAAVALTAPTVTSPQQVEEFGVETGFTPVKAVTPEPRVKRAVSNRAADNRRASRMGVRGISASTQRVLAAVLGNFPSITRVGGVRNDPGSDHHTGHALDFMTSNVELGNAISAYLIANSGSLKIKYIIWRQRVWMPGRGWKLMSDRGGATANHYDHVHVSVY